MQDRLLKFNILKGWESGPAYDLDPDRTNSQVPHYIQCYSYQCLILKNKYFLLHIKNVNISTYLVMHYISPLVKEKKSLGL